MVFKCEVLGTKRKQWQFPDGKSFDGYQVFLSGIDPLDDHKPNGKEAFCPYWTLDQVSGLNLSPGSTVSVDWNRNKKLVPVK